MNLFKLSGDLYRKQTKPEIPAAKRAVMETEKVREKTQTSLEPEIEEDVKQDKPDA